MSALTSINMPLPSARSAPMHDDSEDGEIETWCTVCDRLIILPPVIAQTVPLETAPVVNGKIKKPKSAVVNPPLKRSQAAALAKLARLPVPPSRPKPVEPTRPHLLQRICTTKSFNNQLYCSAECAEIDQKQSDVQIEHLERYMATCGCDSDVNEVLVSPIAFDEPVTAASKDTSAKAATNGDDINYGYFEMAINGVEKSLLERDRRRSLHSNALSGRSNGHGMSWTTGVGMKRKNSRGYTVPSPYETVTAPAPEAASTDSLSSMWSSCDGRTFSDDSSSGAVTRNGALGFGYGGYDLGLPLTSEYSSSGSSGSRRRGSQTSPWSHSMALFTPLVPPAQAKPVSSSPSGLRSSTVNIRSLSNGFANVLPTIDSVPIVQQQDFGSAPAGTASLMQYAAAFHRTSSTTNLPHLTQVITNSKPAEGMPPVRPQLLRGRSSAGSRSTLAFATDGTPQSSKNVRFRDRSASASANFADRGRPAFSPVNVTMLGTSLAPSILRSTPTEGSSTPTQSLVKRSVLNNQQQASSPGAGPASFSALLAAAPMTRSLSKDSARSNRSELASPIFEVDEEMAMRPAERTPMSPGTARPGSALSTSSFKSSSFKGSSQSAQPPFRPYADATMALTIGDEIRSSPLPPPVPIFRSLSPACFGGKSLPTAAPALKSSLTPRPRRATQVAIAVPPTIAASAVPAKLSSSVGPHREWSWEKLAGQCPVKTYDLPEAALGQCNGKTAKPLFYFH
ncbi:hypothetical protein QFC20_003805 [Naganishia adeliensis]|uniref:Uncharacterized protein n=1 Tax=Naganishia adeliensis TaxID=92952 RepID=A0ACC2W5S4_9TREE|nr:hypothetical protein QFC20_003805 [Naganishia adeliensis]